MARYAQKPADRGSQKWLQVAVEVQAACLMEPLAAAVGEKPADIEWLSPLREDQFAEYRDQAFVDRLGIDLPHRPLEDFWPSGGPQWDGLARTIGGQVILIEAKAHIPEMASPATAASSGSRSLVEASLQATRRHLGVGSETDWTRVLYQHNNRLAHLYLLRELNQLPAWLVFVNFVGDEERGGPATAEEWIGASRLAKAILGWPSRHRLMRHVIDLNVEVSGLAAG